MKYFRIIEEKFDTGNIQYRVQYRGWFSWKDVRELVSGTAGAGLPLSTVLRFQSLHEAENWINEQRSRAAPVRRVIGTYGVQG